MSVQLQCAPSRDAWSCNTIEKVHVVYDFPWLLCVIAGCVVLCVNEVLSSLLQTLQPHTLCVCLSACNVHTYVPPPLAVVNVTFEPVS